MTKSILKANAPGLALALLLLLLVSASCAGPDASPAPSASVASESSGADTGLAPDFTLTAIDGSEYSLAGTNGVVRLVDFWATWCAPCREEVPMLNELQAEYGERGFQIVAISDEDADMIRDFVDEYDVEYLNLVGTDDLAQTYGVLGYPAAYLVDTEGRIVKSFVGPKPRKILVRHIEELLAAGPST